ncbi:MAG: hypothetical protein HYT72_02475 [Candidatus Aenigmarchaeota archaeon]|nr:hypothetical protein [Candidatus Aenigmarchaeota archaeon]
MGMFDWFLPKKGIACPKCGHITIDKEFGQQAFQGKALECMLHVYKEGEPIEISSASGNFSIHEGWIEAHDICENCESYFQVKLLIKADIWNGWEYMKRKKKRKNE